jgi:excinuclease UvrABC nuclease subunit
MELSERLKQDMLTAAEELEFEKAAVLRDQMNDVERRINLMKKTKK